MMMTTWFLLVCTSGLGGVGMACTSAQPVTSEKQCESIAHEYSIAVSGSGRIIYRCFKQTVDLEQLPNDPD